MLATDAKAALPLLHEALSDPNDEIRTAASNAIEVIENASRANGNQAT